LSQQGREREENMGLVEELWNGIDE